MNSGIIPPNRNADSIEPKLRDMTFIYHPTKPIKSTKPIRAVLLKSFGFGQVGGEVLLIHPDYILAFLNETQLASYRKKLTGREQKAIKHQWDSIIERNPLVQVKNAPPYTPDLESQLYLTPTARASFDKSSGTWQFSKKSLDQATMDALSNPTIASALPVCAGVGIDVQLISDIPTDNHSFIERNFTEDEVSYCKAQPDPQASFAGRWAAKEAIVKALCSASTQKPNWLKGPGSQLREIQVLPNEFGVPTVMVNNAPSFIKLSISHSGSYAIAIATLTQ